jgi:DNA-binding LytR/AlgR family response regulator
LTVKCIITDDEPLARKGLRGYIGQIGFLELVAVCEDAVQLNNVLKEKKADLLFLDIEMPYMNGIDFLRQNRNAPKVIFTSAYEKYAISGYELDVLDYLLKPIPFERFLRAANKAFDYFQPAGPAQANYIFLKTANKLEKVNFDEILFAEAMENYVGIYLQDKKLVVLGTLKSLLASLPANRFIQPHKSYIVNLHAIKSVEANFFNVGTYQVPISRHLKDEVVQQVVNNNLLKK